MSISHCSWLFMTTGYWAETSSILEQGMLSYSPPPGSAISRSNIEALQCPLHQIISLPIVDLQKIYGKSTDPPIIFGKALMEIDPSIHQFGDKSMKKNM